MVSVSISLPSRGSFHLSLTVLVHYRSLESISPCGMVPADSDKVSRASPYSGSLFEFYIFRLQDCHLLWFAFPHDSTISRIFYSTYEVLQPRINPVWAFPCSLATTKGIDFSFFSSGYLDVSVHRVAFYTTIYSLYDNSTLLLLCSHLRKFLDQSLLTAPQDISLFATSFISF